MMGKSMGVTTSKNFVYGDVYSGDLLTNENSRPMVAQQEEIPSPPTTNTHSTVVDVVKTECLCCCCQLKFSKGEQHSYEMAKTKGRRGNVTSLCVDQSISYVRDLRDTEDRWLVFRYVDLSDKHLNKTPPHGR